MIGGGVAMPDFIQFKVEREAQKQEIMHSFKGTTWKVHKYLQKTFHGGRVRYIYKPRAPKVYKYLDDAQKNLEKIPGYLVAEDGFINNKGQKVVTRRYLVKDNSIGGRIEEFAADVIAEGKRIINSIFKDQYETHVTFISSSEGIKVVDVKGEKISDGLITKGQNLIDSVLNALEKEKKTGVSGGIAGKLKNK